MRIWIDADGCPVRKIVLRIGREFGIEVVQVADRSHDLKEGKVILVDTGTDSADFRIINLAQEGDLLITQDYGAAALALGKGIFAMDQNGKEYTDSNIDQLLFERALSRKIRRSGGKTGNMKKRSSADDGRFEEALRHWLLIHFNESK